MVPSATHIPVDAYMAVLNKKVPVEPDLFKPLRDRLECLYYPYFRYGIF